MIMLYWVKILLLGKILGKVRFGGVTLGYVR